MVKMADDVESLRQSLERFKVSVEGYLQTIEKAIKEIAELGGEDGEV